jgi:hypothetical protein
MPEKEKPFLGHSRGFTGGEKREDGQEIYRLKREGGGEAFLIMPWRSI